MTPDKDIQTLFDSVNVPFTDNEAFLETLNQRLEKVEFIKEVHDAQIRQYKASLVYSLIAGLLAGAGSMVFLQTLPVAAFEKMSSLLDVLTKLEIPSPIAAVDMAVSLFMGIAAFLLARNFKEIRYGHTECLNM